MKISYHYTKPFSKQVDDFELLKKTLGFLKFVSDASLSLAMIPIIYGNISICRSLMCPYRWTEHPHSNDSAQNWSLTLAPETPTVW